MAGVGFRNRYPTVERGQRRQKAAKSLLIRRYQREAVHREREGRVGPANRRRDLQLRG